MTVVKARGFRLGIVFEGTTVPAWQARCLEALAGVEGLEVVAFFVGEEGESLGRRVGSPSLRGLAWAAYQRRLAARGRAFRPVDLEPILAGIEVVRQPIPHEDVAAKLDALLSLLGHEKLPPELGAPPHGQWAFRFGSDSSTVIPSPRLAQEVSRRPPVVTSELARTHGSGFQEVLRGGAFRTVGQSLLGVMDAMYLESAAWPAAVCRQILGGGRGAVGERRPREAGIRDDARVPAATPVLGRASRYFVSWQAERILWADGWNIGVAEAPISSFLSPGAKPPIGWLPEPAGPRLMADPFGVKDGDCIRVLAEEWDLRRGPRLRAIDILKDGSVGPARAIPSLPTVASYPYLFEYEGQIYCVPETARERRAVLHRATSFPDHWVIVGPLVEGIPAGDPTVFQHDDRWWLFCTDVEKARHGRLLAFHADDLAGPWRPHVGNPLKSDVRNSRPAGTPFVHDGQLYRPAQDSSRTYGGAVVLNRIVRLTKTDFEEEVACVVEPDPSGPYPRGLHTLSAVGDVTLIDGKRRRFMWAASRKEMASILRRRLGFGALRKRAAI